MALLATIAILFMFFTGAFAIVPYLVAPKTKKPTDEQFFARVGKAAIGAWVLAGVGVIGWLMGLEHVTRAESLALIVISGVAIVGGRCPLFRRRNRD